MINGRAWWRCAIAANHCNSKILSRLGQIQQLALHVNGLELVSARDLVSVGRLQYFFGLRLTQASSITQVDWLPRLPLSKVKLVK